MLSFNLLYDLKSNQQQKNFHTQPISLFTTVNNIPLKDGFRNKLSLITQ